MKKPQDQQSAHDAYVEAIINYGLALGVATAANNAEALALMTYAANPTDTNATALANAVLAASNANSALTTAWQALLNARQGYQQAGGGNQ
jgi:hypothetical protein